MTESGAFVAGGGGFIRVRDSSQGFSVEWKRQQKLEEERQRLKQAELDRIARKREEDEEKRRILSEQQAREKFREYHDTKRGMALYDYAKARFSHVDDDTANQARAELSDPAFLERYYPERAARQAKANADAEMTPLQVARCKFCRIVFLTAEELGSHYRDTKPCPHRCGVCNHGGDIHVCKKYGGSIIEDRLPVREERMEVYELFME
jgi:hypothetical protein